jgi:hypothetical protein
MRALLLAGRRLRVVALGLSLVAACSGNKQAPPNAPGGKHDAGNAGAVDADVSQPVDSGPVPDTGTPEPGLMGRCAIDSNKIFTVSQRDEPFLETPLAVDPINSRFALPFVANDGNCLEAVHMSSLAGAAASGEPKSDLAIDECSLVLAAVTTAISDQWLVALVDNRDPPYDVWVEPYDAAHKKMGAAQRATQGSSVEKELALVTLRNGEQAMLAWSDEDDHAGQALYARALDKTGTPRADAVRIEQSDTLYYRGLALAALGADGAGLAYLRYSLDFKTSDIVFVALDNNGKPVRAPWVLASNAGPSPSVNLAVDEDSGGIVYSRAEAMTGRQLWFQQIDDTGQAAAARTGTARVSALRFVNAPFKGVDVSVAKLRTSFVVAYRALPAVNQDRAQIRLYFLDRFGAVIGDSDVSYTSLSGGRTAIQSAYDGRVVIGWSEVQPDGKSATKVVRLPCVGG